jgi:hypothetical protein
VPPPPVAQGHAPGRRIAKTSWIRRGYTAEDVVARAVTILWDADLSKGRPHRPERIRAWHPLLVESLLTPTDTARFQDFLGLRVGSSASARGTALALAGGVLVGAGVVGPEVAQRDGGEHHAEHARGTPAGDRAAHAPGVGDQSRPRLATQRPVSV